MRRQSDVSHPLSHSHAQPCPRAQFDHAPALAACSLYSISSICRMMAITALRSSRRDRLQASPSRLSFLFLVPACSASGPAAPAPSPCLCTAVVVVGVRRIERAALVARCRLRAQHISTVVVQSPLVALRRRRRADACKAAGTSWRYCPCCERCRQCNHPLYSAPGCAFSLGTLTLHHKACATLRQKTEKSCDTRRYDLVGGSQRWRRSSRRFFHRSGGRWRSARRVLACRAHSKTHDGTPGQILTSVTSSHPAPPLATCLFCPTGSLGRCRLAPAGPGA